MSNPNDWQFNTGDFYDVPVPDQPPDPAPLVDDSHGDQLPPPAPPPGYQDSPPQELGADAYSYQSPFDTTPNAPPDWVTQQSYVPSQPPPAPAGVGPVDAGAPMPPLAPPAAPPSGGGFSFGPINISQGDLNQFGQGFQFGADSVLGAPTAGLLGNIFGRPLQNQGQALANIPAQTQEMLNRPDTGQAPLNAAGQSAQQALDALNPFSNSDPQHRAELLASGIGTAVQKLEEAAGNPSVAGPLNAATTRAGQTVLKDAADALSSVFMVLSPAAERTLGMVQTGVAERLGMGGFAGLAGRGEIQDPQKGLQQYDAFLKFRQAQSPDVQAQINDYYQSTFYSGNETHLAGAVAIANGMSVADAIQQHQDQARELLGQTVLNPEGLIHPVLEKAGLTHDASIGRDFNAKFGTPLDETPAETMARMAARGDESVQRPLLYNLARDEQRTALNDSREIVNQLMPPNLTGAEMADWLGKFSSGSLADEHPVLADVLNSEKGREARVLVQAMASRTEGDLGPEVTAKLPAGTQAWIEKQRSMGAEDPEIYNRLKPAAQAIVDRAAPIGEADPNILNRIIGTSQTSEEAMARLTTHMQSAVERLIPSAAPGLLQGPVSALKNMAHWGYIASSPAILVHKFVNDVEGMLADKLLTTAPLEHVNNYLQSYDFNLKEAAGLRGSGFMPGVGRERAELPQTAAQMLSQTVRQHSPGAVTDLLGRMTTNFRARMISEGIRQSVASSSRNFFDRFSSAFPDAGNLPDGAKQLMREELRNNLTKENVARVAKLVQEQYPEAFGIERPIGRGPSGPEGAAPATPEPVPPRPPSPNQLLTRDPETLDPVQRQGVAAVRELETMPEGERIKAEVAQAQTLPPEAKIAEINRIQSEEATAHQVRADLADQARKDAFEEVNKPHPVEPPAAEQAPKDVAAQTTQDAANFEQGFTQSKLAIGDALARNEPDVKAFANATTRLEAEKSKLWDNWYYKPVDEAYTRAKNTPYGAARDTAWRKAAEIRTDANRAVTMGAMVRADDYFAAHNNGSHIDGPIDRYGKQYGLMAHDSALANDLRARVSGMFGDYTRDTTAARYPDAPIPEPHNVYEPIKAEQQVSAGQGVGVGGYTRPQSSDVIDEMQQRLRETTGGDAGLNAQYTDEGLRKFLKLSDDVSLRAMQDAGLIRQNNGLWELTDEARSVAASSKEVPTQPKLAAPRPAADLMLSSSLDESGFKGGYPHLINAINVDRAEAGRELLPVPPTGSAPGAWKEALKGATLEEAVKASSDRIGPPRASVAETAQDIVQHMADAGTAVGLSPDEIASQSQEVLKNVSLEARTPNGTVHTVTGDAAGLAQPDAIRQAADTAASRSAAAAPEGREAGGLAGVDAAGGQAAAGNDVQPASEPVAPRNWRAGNNNASVQFDSALQRDLYDYQAAVARRQRGAGERGVGLYDTADPQARLNALTDTYKLDPQEARSLARKVYDDVRGQMQGVADGEARKLTDAITAGGTPAQSSGPLTRAAYEQQLLATAKQTGIPPAQARAQIALMNVAVENIAKLTGQTVDEAYGKYIAGVTKDMPAGAPLFQRLDGLGGAEFWKTHPQYMGHDFESLAKPDIRADRWRMEYKSGNWVLQDRISSETIAEGRNRYDVLVRGNKALEAKGFIGFNPSVEMLRQASGDILKGARSLTDDGRQMLHLFQNTADASTLAHESAHILRGIFDDVADQTQHPQLLADSQYMKEWASDGRRVWDVQAEEKLARGFERYVADGSAPTSRLERVFQQFAGWLKDIYNKVSGDPQIPGEIPPRLREAFDGWFDERIADGNSRVADGVVPNEMYKFLAGEFSQDDVRSMKTAEANDLFNSIHQGLVDDSKRSLDEIAFQAQLEKRMLSDRIAQGDLPAKRDFNRYFELNTENPNTIVARKAWHESGGGRWQPYGGEAGYAKPKLAPMSGREWKLTPGDDVDAWKEMVSEKLTGSKDNWDRVEQMVKDYQSSQRAVLDTARGKRAAANKYALAQRDPRAAAEFGAAKDKTQQNPMFGGGEDSPLVSGVAPSAQAETFKPPEQGQQERMFSTAPEMGQTAMDRNRFARPAQPTSGAPLFQSVSGVVSDAPFDRMNHVRQMSERNAGDVRAAEQTQVPMSSLFRTENGTPMYGRYAVDGEKGWGNDKFVFLGNKPPDTLGKFKAEGSDVGQLRDTFKEGGRSEPGYAVGVMDRVGGGQAVVLTTPGIATRNGPGAELTATIPAEAYRLAKQIDPDAQFILRETNTPGKPIVVVQGKQFDPKAGDFPTRGYILSQGSQESARAERVFGLNDGVPHPEENQAPKIMQPKPVMPTETPKPAELHTQMDQLMDATSRREYAGDRPGTIKAQRDAAYAAQRTDARAELEDALRKGELDSSEYARLKAKLDAGQVTPPIRTQGDAHAMTPEEWKFRGERVNRAVDSLNTEMSARPPALPPDGATRGGPAIDPKTFEANLHDLAAQDRLQATRVAVKRGEFAMPDGPQTNLDKSLDYIQPFHYWMTRNARNWAQRALEHPEFIGTYLRYQNYLKQTQSGNPAGLKNSIQTSWNGTPLYFDVMKTINPLERFVNNFQMQNKTNDPAINALNMGANVGVNPWFPLKWLYALSIRNSDPAAFRQLIGHDIPLSSDIKYGTAGLKDATGGKGPFGNIPPGGTYLEGMLFKELGSGDAGENNRIGKALYQMYASGATNPETGKPITLDEVKRAAFNQQSVADIPNGAKQFPKGTLWDAATQAAAVKRTAPEVLTWLGAKGLTSYDQIDANVAQARKDWAALPWSGGDGMQLKSDLRQFYDQYPWYPAITLSNKDSQDRNALFASDVLGRIPPGGKTAIYDAAGVKDLVNGFFAAKGSLGKSDYINNLPADQQQKFMQFITDSDKKYVSPTMAQQQEWDAYNALAQKYFAPGTSPAEKTAMKANSPLLQKYLGTSDAERFWNTYTALDPIGRQIARAQIPNVGQYIDKGTRADTTPAGLKTFADQIDKIAKGLQATPSYQDYVQQVGAKFGGPDIYKLQSQYYAIPKTDTAAQAQFRTDNPQLGAYWTWQKAYLASHLDLSAALKGQAVAPVQPGGAQAPGQASSTVAAPKPTLSPASSAAYAAFNQARDQQFPGVDITGLTQKYFSTPAGAARSAFLQANPSLKQYFDWNTSYSQANPGIVSARAEAQKLYQSQPAASNTSAAAGAGGAAISPTAAQSIAQALAPMRAELTQYFGGGGGRSSGGGGSRSISSAGRRLISAAQSRYAPRASTAAVLKAITPFYRLQGTGSSGASAGGSAPYIRTVRYISSPYERRR